MRARILFVGIMAVALAPRLVASALAQTGLMLATGDQDGLDAH